MATVNVPREREGPAMRVKIGVKGGDITLGCGALQRTSHMHVGLCRGHVGVVWWVWFGRSPRIRAYVRTFVHTYEGVNDGVNHIGAGMGGRDQAPQACQGHLWASH